jgi:hypothetical protein
MPADPLLGVLSHPRDDAAREAFAATIAATDSERARLVRVQLEIARFRRQDVPAERYAAQSREADRLVRAGAARWGNGLERLVPPGDPWRSAWTWRRGFVEGVQMAPGAFLAQADALFRAAPVLDLTLTSSEGVEELFDSPFLARLRSLSCFNLKLGEARVAALVASPFATSLLWLDLGFNRLGDDAIEALVTAPTLASLRYVRLLGNPGEDPNPTDDEGEGIVHGTLGSPRAVELRKRHGAIRCLGRWTSADPPDPEALG